MKRVCAFSGKEFEVSKLELELLEKLGAPLPRLAPRERRRRRLAWRNERNFFHRNCGLCSKAMLAIYPPSAEFPVYCNSCWWGDKWDAASYASEYDFERPLFEQFGEMVRKVPRLALFAFSNINSGYTTNSGENKNCYLCYSAVYNEDCLYCSNIDRSRSCADCLNVVNSELCYQCIDILNCYGAYYSQDCDNCNDVYFCKNCIGCHDCYGCKNLRQKQYHWFNEPLSRKEYEKRLSALSLGSSQGTLALKEQAERFWLSLPERALMQINCENCTGNYLRNCKNCSDCFDCYELEDCAQLQRSFKSKDSLGGYGTWENELQYETNASNNRNAFVNNHGSYNSDIFYTDLCFSSKHLFACIGLRNKSCCILNKEYSKADYEAMLPRIIEQMKENKEWGMYFPIEISPFEYNESLAADFLPLTQEQVLSYGWRWRDEEKRERGEESYLLPDLITDVPDEVVGKTISCAACDRQYAVQKLELKFYRDMHLSLPRSCPECRRLQRVNSRNPQELFTRSCDKCGILMQSSYAPERREVVFCAECYEKAIP